MSKKNINAGIKVLKKAARDMADKIKRANREYRATTELIIPLIEKVGELEFGINSCYGKHHTMKCYIENVENVDLFIEIINFMNNKYFSEKDYFVKDYFVRAQLFSSYTKYYIGEYSIESNLFDLDISKNKHICKNGDEVILSSTWKTYGDFMDFIEVCRV